MFNNDDNNDYDDVLINLIYYYDELMIILNFSTWKQGLEIKGLRFNQARIKLLVSRTNHKFFQVDGPAQSVEKV